MRICRLSSVESEMDFFHSSARRETAALSGFASSFPGPAVPRNGCRLMGMKPA